MLAEMNHRGGMTLHNRAVVRRRVAVKREDLAPEEIAMASERKKTRLEQFHELMQSLGGDWLDAEFDAAAEVNDPSWRRERVVWSEAPDPFGMDWEWLTPKEPPSPADLPG